MLDRIGNVARQTKNYLCDLLDPGSPPGRSLRGNTRYIGIESQIADQVYTNFRQNARGRINAEYGQIEPLLRTLEGELDFLSGGGATNFDTVDGPLSVLEEKLENMESLLKQDLTMIQTNIYALERRIGNSDPRLKQELASYGRAYENLVVVRAMYKGGAWIYSFLDRERKVVYRAGQKVRAAKISLQKLKSETDDVILTLQGVAAEIGQAREKFENYEDYLPENPSNPTLAFVETFEYEFGMVPRIENVMETFQREYDRRNRALSEAGEAIREMRDAVRGLSKSN